MGTARTDGVLPRQVREIQVASGSRAAGESLLEHGEHLARSEPERAMDLAEVLLDGIGRQDPLAPFAAWTAGVIHHLTGRTGGARPLLERAARSFAARKRPDLADRVRLLLIDVYGELLHTTRARRLARRIEARFRSRGDLERAAIAVSNLGCAVDAADRISEATRLWRHALHRLPEGSLRRLLVVANLANAASTTGRFEEARDRHCEVATAARERGFTALALQAELNLAETEFAMGRVEASFRRWLGVINEARSCGDPLIELVAIVELAGAEVTLGDGQAAARRLRPVLPRLEGLGLRLEWARALRLLAVLEAASPSPDRAVVARAREALDQTGLEVQRELLEVELAQVRAAADPERVRTAARRLARWGLRHRSLVALAWAARVHLDRGENEQALSLAREVLSSRVRSPWSRLVAHHVCAQALGARTGPGARHLTQAVRAADQVHGSLLSASDRSAFLRAHGEVYLAQISRLVERGSARDLRRCLDLLHRLKSGWLVDQLTLRADRGSDPLVRRWQELRRELATLLDSSRGEDEPRVRYAGVAVGGELDRLEHELREVETDLARTRPVLARALLPTKPAKDLCQSLPEGHLLLEYLVAPDELVIFVVDSSGLDVVVRRGVVQEVTDLVASVRFHMDVHPRAGERAADQRRRTLEARLARLGEILLEGVVDRGWSTLWVAPHDGLYHLPWAALPNGYGIPLLDLGPFSIVPGAATASALMDQPSRAPVRVALAGTRSSRLPLVRHEVEALAHLVPDSILVDEVTREQLLDLLATTDAVHLAGHSVFLDGAPSASGLQLDDGYLTVHDLAAAPIRASLVTFGVCSAVRLASDDNLHFEGFLRALLAAGVRTVVGPLASVRDDVACAFAETFYSTLMTSSSPGTAYRAAVSALRRADPHPAAWGSFHPYGDLRPWRVP